MKFQSPVQFALVASVAIIMSAGCGGVTSRVPSAPTLYPYDVSTSRLGVLPLAHRDRTQAWMAREAKESDLLYVSSEMTNDVDVFSYPQLKREGVLSGFDSLNGLCSDSEGDVFIPDELKNIIFEFAHGSTKRMSYLIDTGEAPVACSIDPTSGTLAVANVTSLTLGAGSVSLYANASGSPLIISDPAVLLVYECGFDDQGDLFIDGLTNFPSQGGVFQFAELPKGSSSFTNIALDKRIKLPGAVQWDGKFVTVADAQNGVIYRTNGAGGKIESSTKLAGARFDFQSWIQGKTIIAPSVVSIKTGFWHYPAGGKKYKMVKVGSPFGATVSAAPK